MSVYWSKQMNNVLLNLKDPDTELKELFENIEKISADVDLYGQLVDERLLKEAE